MTPLSLPRPSVRPALARAASTLALFALTAAAAAAQPVITVAPQSGTIQEGETGTFIFSLSEAATETIAFQFGVNTDQTDINGDDIAPGEGFSGLTVTFNPGDDQATRTIGIADDADVEGDESIQIGLRTVTQGSATFGTPNTATITIEDDDDPVTVSLSADPATIAEDGGTSEITATLSGTTNGDVTIELSAADDDGDDADDAFAIAPTTIVIPQGQTTGTATLTASDDADDDSETVTVSVDSATNAGAGEVNEAGGDATTTVQVTDSDGAQPALTVVLEASPTTIAEPGGTLPSESTITARLQGGTTTETITVSIAPRNNDADGSFALDSQTITIQPNATSGSTTLRAQTDDNDDQDVAIIEVTGISGSDNDGDNDPTEAGGDATAVVTIEDNVPAAAPPTVTIDIDEDRIDEGQSSGVTVRISESPSEQVTVSLNVTDGDGTLSADNVVFAANTTNLTRSVTLTAGTDADEDDETITVSIDDIDGDDSDGSDDTNDAVAGTPSFDTVQVDDTTAPGGGIDDVTVSFAAVQSSVSEGAGTFDLQLELSEALDSDAQVTISLSQGSPADLGGFTTRTVTVPADTTSFTVPITITDDDVREDAETFTFQLSTSADRLTVDRGTTQLTVLDDDVTALVISEVDGIVGPMGYRFVELRVSDGNTGATDGLTLALYGADSTVVQTQSLDGLDTGDDGFLVVCDEDGADAVCDIEVEIDDIDGGFSGIALFRGGGPLEGDDFDNDDDDLIDSVFIDERFAATQRGLDAEDGSLQRQDTGRFAFVVPPTPGAANNVGNAVSNGPDAVVEAVGNVFPNPSAGRAALELTVASAQAVTVSVFDALGRQVAVAFDGEARPGAPVRVSLDGAAMAPGVYIVRVAGETFTEARRLTVTR